MKINKAITYRGSWDQLIDYVPEWNDCKTCLDELFRNVKSASEFIRPSYLDIWDNLLVEKGWITSNKTLKIKQGETIHLNYIGPIRNDVSVQIHLGLTSPTDWIFRHSTIASKVKLIKLPILLVPIRDHNITVLNDLKPDFTFEKCVIELNNIAPLNHLYPFLILGYCESEVDDENKIGLVEMHYIESAFPDLINKTIVDKGIVFPEGYHEAGLGILNFFGTYIREQYPNVKAKIRIDQEDDLVRLIVETLDGKIEVIEKALEEYQLIISRKAQPEDFITNKTLLLKMENQLAIAEVQLKNQARIIGFQEHNIEKLQGLLEKALSTSHSFNFAVNASSTNNNSNTNTNTLTFTQNISSAIGNINELKDLLSGDKETQKKLLELEATLEKIEKETDPETLKKSPAMSKFKRIVETMTEGHEQLGKAIKAAEGGIDIARDLAYKYNSIAEWCGLPQVPKLFTK